MGWFGIEPEPEPKPEFIGAGTLEIDRVSPEWERIVSDWLAENRREVMDIDRIGAAWDPYAMDFDALSFRVRWKFGAASSSPFGVTKLTGL